MKTHFSNSQKSQNSTLITDKIFDKPTLPEIAALLHE